MKHMFLRYIAVVLTVFFIFPISSCNNFISTGIDTQPSKTSMTDGSTQILDSGPVKGGTLKVFSTYVDTLNPLATKNRYVREFLNLVYDSLFTLDNQYRAQSNLVDKYECSADGITWTFKLKEGIHWQDGDLLDANDVIFTMQAISNSSLNSIFQANLRNITTFSLVDQSTFTITLNKPNPFLPALLTFPIIPKSVGAQIQNSNWTKNMLIGSGPYEFVSYSENSEVHLKANDNWWKRSRKNSDLTYPLISEISVKLYKSSDDAINAIQSGDVQVCLTNSSVINKYDLRNDVNVVKFSERSMEALIFNMQKPPLTDKALRQAICSGIDRNTIIDTLVNGRATVSDLPVFRNTWLNQLLVPEIMFNVEHSKQLLTAANWKFENNYWHTNVNGTYYSTYLNLIVNNDNSVRVQMADIISAQLKAVGINVTVNAVSWDEEQIMIADKKFDIALTGFNLSNSQDISFLYSTDAISLGTNYAGYSNADADALFSKLALTQAANEQSQLYTKLLTIFEEDLPYYGLYFNDAGVIYSKKIKGVVMPSSNEIYYGIENWYLPEG